MDAPIHEETLRGHTIKIYNDTDTENPRDWENLGTMSCWHNRYDLGDRHHHYSPRHFLESLSELDGDSELSMYKLLARAERKAVILPLYLYDHSGITMNTTGFYCPWDSGQVGFIHVDLATIRKEYGCTRVSFAMRNRITKQLRQEVATYDDYLRGNCFGYVVERDSEEIGSCWGFLGDYDDYCLKEARAAVPKEQAHGAD